MKKTMMKAGLLALAMGVSSVASAEINYSYVEGGFGQLDEGEAVFLNGAVDLDKNWGVIGGVQVGNYDLPWGDADQLLLEAGVQFHQPLKSNVSIHGGVKLLYAEWESDVNVCAGIPGWFYSCARSNESADEIGLVGNVGLRFQVQPKLQLEGDVKLIANDAMADDGLGLQGAARYFISPQLSVAGGIAIDTELDGLFASLRYDL